MNAFLSRRRRIASLVLLAALFSPALGSGRDLIPAGAASVWKYLDDGAEPGEGWRRAGFDDSKWKSGSAPLGYGEQRLGAQVGWGADKAHKPITTWFRREFDAPELPPGERLVLSLCLDDGAVVYLNGVEVGRANLPAGRLAAGTPAQRDITNALEGFYYRIPIPRDALRPGAKNLLAAEVHQASAGSDDLFFDLALKSVAGESNAPAVPIVARAIMNTFHKQHFIGPGVAIPDGYIDGGRHMVFDGEGHATSGREILLVDRARDLELSSQLAFARSSVLQSLPPLERAQRLAAHIDAATTPPGGERWVGQTVDQITREFANKPLLIGDVLDQCQAGVCRHRALLFKILADEAGLRCALVRGNYARSGPPGFAHAWNEITLEDGRRVLVDVMHHGGKASFPEVTTPGVIKHYLRENDTPWYTEGTAAAPTDKSAAPGRSKPKD